MEPTTRKRWLLGPALALLTLAVFWPVAGHGFLNYDDDLYVTENPRVLEGPSLPNLTWACTTGHAGNWHPLTWLSHMIDGGLYGNRARGHHLTSLVLHLLNVVGLFWLLDHLTRAAWRSALVAALFAVHPLHVESVAWIAERKDVLSGFFWLATLGAYVRYCARPGAWRYAALLGAFLLGLLAKPMLVTLPLILLLLDGWPLRRLDAGRVVVLEKLPLLGLAAASSVVTFLVQRAGAAVGSFEQYPPSLRLANALQSYVLYIRDMFWPQALSVFYPYPASVSWLHSAAALALLLALSLLALRLRARRPYLLFGWLWYLIALVPVIGLVQVGEQARADRYTYLPLIGLFIAGGFWLADLAPRSSAARRVLPAAAAGIVIALGLVSQAQLRHWRDSVTLFNHALRIDPDNPTARLNLGMALTDLGRWNEALPHLRRAVELRPGLAKAHNNLGAALVGSGNRREALESFRTALRLDPASPEALTNLGNQSADAGRFEEAAAYYRRATEAAPGHAEAYYNWGTTLAQQQRWDEAIELLSRAVALRPGYAAAHLNLGSTLYHRGEYERAWQQIKRAQELGYPVPPETLQRVRGRVLS